MTVAPDPTTPCPDCGEAEYDLVSGPSDVGEYLVRCVAVGCGTTFHVSADEIAEVGI